MAAFEKDLIENLRGNISVSIHSETVVNLFYERTILLFCFEVAFNIPLKNAQKWRSSNTSLDRSIDRSLRVFRFPLRSRAGYVDCSRMNVFNIINMSR